MNNTPRGSRLHIGFFGKRNSGKSSLINAFTEQKISIVSEVPGTTTDPVYKAMEIYGIGQVILIDTAGFDDKGYLGDLRVDKTLKVAEKIDMAVLLFSEVEMKEEVKWFKKFKSMKTPVLCVISKGDINKNNIEIACKIKEELNVIPFELRINEKITISLLKEEIIRLIPEDFERKSILGNLVVEGDIVLLVMPQDLQAPKGRLILPQVQTIRDLLDNKCVIISTTTDKFLEALLVMVKAPKLIIVDSQVFPEVYEKKPRESFLTSFSILFAAYKGDIIYYIEGAKAIDKLREESKVLIAECCTHVPLEGDIGREKIPVLLRKKIGDKLTVDIVNGADFPEDLRKYDLIIQCGGCMFNRKYIMSRIKRAKEQKVAMSNYGVVIAYLNGILDKIIY